jgi:hypothetical protein
MKNKHHVWLLAAAILLSCCLPAHAQDNNFNVVAITKLKMKMVEGGSRAERDSLIAIYVDKVIKKNSFILSHMECSHWFTDDNTDYIVIEEYKTFDDMTAANEMSIKLEDEAWPDEKQRDAFLDAMNAYFEDWHGDMLMRKYPGTSK